MGTKRQDDDFKKEVIFNNLPESLLDDAVQFIGKTLCPEDVFRDDDLKKWAQAQGPNDVFDASALEEWALSNGFVKE